MSYESFDENHYNDFLKEYKIYFNDRQKSYNSHLINTTEKTENSEISFLLSKANSLYLSYKLDEAKMVLHEIIRLDPNIQEVYNLLSLIYEEKQDIKNSLYFLMIAAHLSQGDSEIWIKCFNLNKKMNNTLQAEYCISRAVKVEKDNPYFLYEKAIINEELNNFKKAANTYKKLLEISDSNSDILVHTSNIYEKVLKNNEKAINLLKTHFHQTAKKLMILNKLYFLYLDMSKFEEIIFFFENNSTNEDENVRKTFENFVIKIIIKIAFLAIKQKQKSENLAKNKQIPAINQIKGELISFFKEFLLNDFKIKIKLQDNNQSGNIVFSEQTFKISKNQFKKFFNKIFEIYNGNDNLEEFIEFFEKIENDVYDKDNIKVFYEDFDFSKKSQIHYDLELELENFVLISDYFSKLKSYDKAIEYLNRTLYFSTLKNNKDTVFLILKMSEILNLKGDNIKALEILNKTNIPIKNELIRKNNILSNSELKDALFDENVFKSTIENEGNFYNNKNKNLENKKTNSYNENFNQDEAIYNNDNLYFDLEKNKILEEQENCEKNFLANLIFKHENPLEESYESEGYINEKVCNYKKDNLFFEPDNEIDGMILKLDIKIKIKN